MRNEEGNRYDGRGHRPLTRPTAAVGADDENFTAVRALDPQSGEKKWEFKLNTGNSLHTFEGWQTTAGAAGILTTASDVLFTGGREVISSLWMLVMVRCCGKQRSVAL